MMTTALALVGEPEHSLEEARRAMAAFEADLGDDHALAAQLSRHYLAVLEQRGATAQTEAFRRARP
jgi:hypothetical protein